jgi:hypothetical protein
MLRSRPAGPRRRFCPGPSADTSTSDSPAVDNPAMDTPAAGIVAAARLVLPHLERGERIDAALLRQAMEDRLRRVGRAGRVGLEDGL